MFHLNPQTCIMRPFEMRHEDISHIYLWYSLLAVSILKERSECLTGLRGSKKTTTKKTIET